MGSGGKDSNPVSAMRIFVTGATSFIGRELVRQCGEHQIDVGGIDLVAGDDPRFEVCDIRDPAVADHIPEGADALVHLAALSRDPDCRGKALECFDINVMGTLNLMQACRARKVKQFIFASSEWVYDRFDPGGDPKREDDAIDMAHLKSEYALSKAVSEANLRQMYLEGFCPVTILRFGIVYGPRRENWSALESIFHKVATENEVVVGSLKTGRHFIHVSDVASAIRASLGLGGFEILNIQWDVLISLGDIVAASQRILGREVNVMESAPDRASVRPVSNEKARAILDWRPEVDLERGLRSVRDFLKL